MDIEDYKVAEVLERLNNMVPNGSQTENGIGGVGTRVLNHRVPFGPSISENALNIRAIGMGVKVLRCERCEANMMIVHPVQDKEIKSIEFLYGNRDSSLTAYTIFVTISVVVCEHQPVGQVLLMDTRSYEKHEDGDTRRFDALVMLWGGKTK